MPGFKVRHIDVDKHILHEISGLIISESEMIPSENLTAAIQLPESLFMMTSVNSTDDGVGVVVSVYETSLLFPLANGTRPRVEIRTPVIGALIGGVPSVSGLTDPVVITLKLDINTVSHHFYYISHIILHRIYSLCRHMKKLLMQHVAVGILQLQVLYSARNN